jgi:hypothetical protein
MARNNGYQVPRRWRWYVLEVARREGYTRIGGFLWTMYGPNTLALFGSLFRNP